MGLVRFAIALLVCASAHAQNQPGPPRRESLAGPADWNFRRLKQVLSKSGASTVGELIAAINDEDASFFQRWTRFKSSQSRQEGTLRDPRLIAFSNDAGLILTFNGDPSERGYATVEAMEFNPQRGYELREIHFPKEGRERGFTQSEIEVDLGHAVVSAANPRECGMCHGIDRPRPIWDAYFIWPGAYGTDDDAEAPDEREAKQQYAAYWAGHDRYEIPQRTPVPPSIYEADAGYRRNLTLTRLFSLQMSRMLAHDAAARPGLLTGLYACRGRARPYENELFRESRERLEGLESEYGSDPLIKGAGRTLFKTAAGAVLEVEAALASWGGDAAAYLPLQRRGAYFEDGAGSFRYLSKVIDEETPGLGMDEANCRKFWSDANARYLARKAARRSAP